jgi:phenylalanyl-tRNA synthetase beta chain
MGGLNSEITESTKTVLFESAKFDGANIRVTAKALGMGTEASQRFAKGVDIETTQTALERACQLVEELGAGEVEKGVIDVCKGELERRKITARPERVNALIALQVPTEKMVEILNSLCIPTTLESDGLLHIEIPHFRDDIIEEADISEEIARVVGYDNIPLTLMKGDLVRGALTERQKRIDAVRTLLCAQEGLKRLLWFHGQRDLR